MVLDESETLPLLQGELASRSGRRATRRVLAAAAATLVALSALYSATVPRAPWPRRRVPVQNELDRGGDRKESGG